MWAYIISIPSVLTWRLQPLGISINKAFKEILRRKYLGFWKGKNNTKVLKSAIIKWINELWHSDFVLSNEMILILSSIQGLVTH